MSELISYIRKQPFLYFKSGTDDSAIKSAESVLNCRFADDYRDYLKEFGVASFNGHEMTGICDSKRLNVVDVTLANRDYFGVDGKCLYVVEETNIDDIVIWQNCDGQVFMSQPGHPFTKRANSLTEYFQNLK